jgi:PAS domain S-box-containing protein
MYGLGLRTKLLLVALVSVAPVLPVGVLIYEALDAQLAASRSVQDTFEVIHLSREAADRLVEVQTSMGAYLLYSDVDPLRASRQAWRDYADRAGQLWSRVADRPGQQRRVEMVFEQAEAWRTQMVERAAAAYDDGAWDEAVRLSRRSRDVMRQLRDEIRAFEAAEEAVLGQRTAAQARAQRRTMLFTIAGTVASFVLGLGAAALLGGSITRPLARLTRAAEAVAAGDTTQRVLVKAHDELGVLAGAFDIMVGEITRRVSQLERARGEAEALLDIARAIGGTTDLQEALRLLCRALGQLTGADTVAAYVRDEAAEALRPVAAYRVPKEMLPVLATLEVPLAGQEFAADVLERGHLVWSDEVAADPRFSFAAFRTYPHQSGVVVPMVLDGRVGGAFYLAWWHERRRIDESETERLRTIGQQTGVLLRNARLYDESLRRGRQLETLVGVARALNESLDTGAVLTTVVEAASRLVDRGVCRLWIVDGVRVRLVAEAGIDAPVAEVEVPLGAGLIGQVAADRRPLVLDDVQDHPGLLHADAIRGQGLVSVAALPLVVGERCLGAFSVFTRRRHAFSAAEVAALQALADQAAVVLDKARLFEDAQERRRVAEQLHGLISAMQRTVDLDDRLTLFAAAAPGALGFDRLNIFLPTADGDAVALRAGTNAVQARHARIALGPEAGALNEAWESGEVVIVADDAGLAAVPLLGPDLASHPALRSRRFAVVPLKFRGRSIGLVGADNKLSRRPITRRAVAQLELFCQALAAAVSNARLFEETQQQKTRLEQIFSSTSDGILVLDLDGRIVALNSRGGALLGVDARAVTGKPVAALVEAVGAPGAWSARGGPALQALAEGRAAPASGDLELDQPAPRTLRWHAEPTRDATGKRVGVTLTLQDVTREREIDRMKTEFVSIVSHELRTPLTSIKGSLHLLLTDDDPPLAPTHRELVEISTKNSDRLIRLINDILDISKIEAGRIDLHLESHRPVEFVAVAVDGIRSVADERGVRIETAVAGDLPLVLVDFDRIVQVMTNLLSNAVKFSPAGGRVMVKADVSGDALEIRVRDEGRGIAAADLPNLFQKFRQLDSSSVRVAGGTGLGLAITRGIVEEHGGRVRVESMLGLGSTFIVELPVPATAQPAPPPEPSRPAAIGRPRVLVVDDEPEVRAELRAYLEGDGFDVLEAGRALDGVDLARRERPDLVTMDILLPDLDGFEAVRLLREHEETRGIPVVVVSVTRTRSSSAETDIAAYVTKPVDEGELLLRVHAALALQGARAPVLVVDDDADVRWTVTQLLARAGLETMTAADGEEALASIAARRPALVILDVAMPGLGGHEVLRRLRQEPATRSLPVIILTAGSSGAGRSELMELGAGEYVRKPFSAPELLQTIRTHLAGPVAS